MLAYSSERKWTPLGYAILKQNVAVVGLILDRGAHVDATFVRPAAEMTRPVLTHTCSTCGAQLLHPSTH